jgi:hypothetical protein
MAIEILAELLIVVPAEAAASYFGQRWFSEWKIGSFFEKLDAPRQRAFLEVAAAAVMEDGTLSDAEREWLDRRREGSKEADVVDAAIATATEMLPPRDHPDELRAYIARRAEVLTGTEEREKTLAVAATILFKSGKPDHETLSTLFGEALGVDAARIGAIQGMIKSNQVP